jgi:hypothetical protein
MSFRVFEFSSLTVLALVACAPARGQDIAQAVKQESDGTVRLIFASKPNVCGDGQTFISIRDDDDTNGEHTYYRQTRSGFNINTTGRGKHNGDWEYSDCHHGPVRVDLRVRNGEVVHVEAYVGPLVPQPVTKVGARAAVDYLLTLTEKSDQIDVAKHAIFPAMLADSVEPWERLLKIGRNTALPREVRKSAIFWLGQGAGDAATPGLTSVLSDDDVEIKKSAIFALSQIRGEQSVKALIDVVHNVKDREVRKSALFLAGAVR